MVSRSLNVCFGGGGLQERNSCSFKVGSIGFSCSFKVGSIGFGVKGFGFRLGFRVVASISEPMFYLDHGRATFRSTSAQPRVPDLEVVGSCHRSGSPGANGCLLQTVPRTTKLRPTKAPDCQCHGNRAC